MADDIATRRFYAWCNTHLHEASDPYAAWHAAWQQGGRYALLCSSELAELVPRLESVTRFFAEHQVEIESVQEELPF